MTHAAKEVVTLVVRRSFRLGAFVAFTLVLTGCGPDLDDLDDFFKTVREKPGGTIEPLPEFAAYEPFAYGAMGLRSPFDPPVRVRPRQLGPGGREVRPDLNRPKQYLEQFNVIDLKMVGTLNRPGEFYALVREPTGGVHRVKIGDYLGQNYGRITGLSAANVELTEIVSDGVGGWQERNRMLNLGGSTSEEGEGGPADGEQAAGGEPAEGVDP